MSLDLSPNVCCEDVFTSMSKNHARIGMFGAVCSKLGMGIIRGCDRD